VIGLLPGETSCVSLVWAVLDRASRGFTITTAGIRLLQDIRRQLLDPPTPIRRHAKQVHQPAADAA
jgi:putative transposase